MSLPSNPALLLLGRRNKVRNFSKLAKTTGFYKIFVRSTHDKVLYGIFNFGNLYAADKSLRNRGYKFYAPLNERF